MQSEVARLHPLRVLLASADRRWLRVAQVLLERGGYVVHASDGGADAAAAALRRRSNVVVLDVSSSLTAAARTIAAIEALHPRVHAIAVGERPDTPFDGLPVLAKWAGLNQLGAEVERAYLSDREARGARVGAR